MSSSSDEVPAHEDDTVTPETAPFTRSFYARACRLGDDNVLTEKMVFDLYNEVLRLATAPPEASNTSSKCITIPNKFLPFDHTGIEFVSSVTVLRWSDFPQSQIKFIFHFLEKHSRKNCFAATQNEICLNPHHYYTQDEPSDGPSAKETWATIVYYERQRRLSSTFTCRSNSVTVGCYDGDHEDIFNLSEVIRADCNGDWEVENCRREIQGGFRLHYYNGRVQIQHLSNMVTFSQTRCQTYNYEWYRRFRRGPRNPFIELLDENNFARIVERCLARDGIEGVYNLAKLCTIRLSFGGPWWSYRREGEQNVTSAPCWVEIRLIRQLKRLEIMLAQMGSPYKLHY